MIAKGLSAMTDKDATIDTLLKQNRAMHEAGDAIANQLAARDAELAKLREENEALRLALQNIISEVQRELRGQVAKTIFDYADRALAASSTERAGHNTKGGAE